MQPDNLTQEIKNQDLLDEIELVIGRFGQKRQVRVLQQIIQNQKYFYEYSLCLEGKLRVQIMLILEQSNNNLFIKLRSELKKYKKVDLLKLNNFINLESNPCITIYSDFSEKTVEAKALILKEKREINRFFYQELILKDLQMMEKQLKKLLVISLNQQTSSSQNQKLTRSSKLQQKKKDQLLKKLAAWIITWRQRIKQNTSIDNYCQIKVRQGIESFRINPSIQTKPIITLQQELQKKQIQYDKITKACADKPQKQDQKNQTIVKTIKILRQEIDYEWRSPSVNCCGLIQKIKAKYKLRNSSLHLRISLNFQEKIDEQCDGLIVKKSPINGSNCPQAIQKSLDSFRTEVWAIFYLRSEQCPSIASYYFPEVSSSFSQLEHFYLKWYDCTFSTFLEKQANPKIILLIFKGIIQCLKFLSARNLCHRDLKSDNVLIGENFIPKIIDFGSACPTYGNKIHKTLSGKLRSTRGYYSSPNQIVDERIQQMILKQAEVDASGMKEYQKEEELYEIVARHKKFDIFSFGAILECWLQNENKLKENIFVYKKIVQIARICKSVSPLNRPCPDDILIYWKLLLKYWETASSRQQAPLSDIS